jgi:hypothetical protein
MLAGINGSVRLSRLVRFRSNRLASEERAHVVEGLLRVEACKKAHSLSAPISRHRT